MKRTFIYWPLLICLGLATWFAFLNLPGEVEDDSRASIAGVSSVRATLVEKKLHVQIRRPEGETWPTGGSIDVWLARLDGTPVAVGKDLVDDRSHDRVAAVLPDNKVTPGEEALYVLRYTIGQGEQAVRGSVSLAEAIGSLSLALAGTDTLQAGSQAAVRVRVYERFTGEPISEAKVNLSLTAKEGAALGILSCLTDAGGTCRVAFHLPDQPYPEAQLVAAAAWRGQSVTLTQTVAIRRNAKILLTSDKPLYQPGQTMHLRALALTMGTRRPVAEAAGVFEVQDAKGNKVFKKAVKTDDYGIMHADFVLADEVNMGDYQLRAILGDDTVEKTVEVKRYVLPKFKVAIEADRAWYQPGEVIAGTVDAQYIFGKPVAGGRVVIEGLATVVGVEQFIEIKGETDKEGKYHFEMKLPDTLVGRQAEQGLARVQIHATVTDPAAHTQEALRSYPVAKEGLVVQALPESGQLTPGVTNKLYVLVTTPDGQPTRARVQAWAKAGDTIRRLSDTATDELGLAEFAISVPADLRGLAYEIIAEDDAGHYVKQVLAPEQTGLSPLLLRPDRPTYRLGDVLNLTVLLPQAGPRTAFIDLIRDNQTLLTASAPIADGRAELAIPITAEMVGGVVVTAYAFIDQGNLVRDSRLIYVHPEADLWVEIKPERETSRPGEETALDFAVTDQSGHPVAAALGVTIVDEAVFALQDMQPGLEKIFFTIEAELMKPRVEYHRFTPALVILEPVDDVAMRRGQTAMLAAIEPVFSVGAEQHQAGDLRPEIREKLLAQMKTELQRLEKELVRLNRAKKTFAPEQLLDPWFTPYQVSHYRDDLYHLASAGPDRRWGTADDLQVDNEKLGRKGMARAGRGAGGAFPDGEVMFDMALEEAEMAVPAIGGAFAVDDIKTMETVSSGEQSGGETIRIRQFFPETLYVNPALITDADGRARLTLPLADSIPTWRVAAQAVSRLGFLGSGTGPLRVFQDFFIDIDFPAALTRNDEVQVPIALYNYLSTDQTVVLEIEPADWCEMLQGGPTRRVSLRPGEVKAEILHLKAVKVGSHSLTVVAKGSKQSDAVKRLVRVEPDGKLCETNIADQLKERKEHRIDFPAGAIPGADQLLLKVHAGLVSQVMEGLDGIFRMPNGCFEQTSSTTYPNVMVLDYLKTSKQLTPEIQMKAEGYINQGYQRLLTFEVPGGGFEWFGQAPAHVILTAYGVMEFHDMGKVYNVDPNLIRRTQNWLAAQQQPDGSWKPNTKVLDTVASAFTKDVLRNTAYVAWALARTEYRGEPLKNGVAYIEKHLDEAADVYTLALAANALAHGGGSAAAIDRVFAKLDKLRKEENDVSYWPTSESTAIGSNGKSADIESTALVAMALLHAKRQPQTVNRVIAFLVKSKDAFGTYYSTQATIWSMHVMLAAAAGSGSDIDGRLTIRVNGREAESFRITPADADVMRQAELGRLLAEGGNDVSLTWEGKGEVSYQLVGRYYLPWDRTPEPPPSPVSIDVRYDKTRLAVDEEVTCTATVENRAPGEFGMVVVDLGVPPGFTPDRDSLAQLVSRRTVSKFSTTARQITFYLDKLEENKPAVLSFRLKAAFPMHAVAPKSKVYNYYDPATQAVAEPVEFTVE